MRIQNNILGEMYRVALVLLLVVLLASCAPIMMTSPPRAQRTYDRIAAVELYTLMESIFTNAGFNISQRDLSRGYMQTSWKEYEGDAHGLFKWKERRMYSAWFDVDRLNGRHMLVLQLIVEERPPSGSGWSTKQIAPDEYPEYLQFLQKLDQAVKNHGGVAV
jgi:hypothetical protein